MPTVTVPSASRRAHSWLSAKRSSAGILLIFYVLKRKCQRPAARKTKETDADHAFEPAHRPALPDVAARFCRKQREQRAPDETQRIEDRDQQHALIGRVRAGADELRQRGEKEDRDLWIQHRAQETDRKSVV